VTTGGHRRRTLGAAAGLAAVAVLAGCAEVMLVSSTTAMVKSLPSSQPHWVQTNRLTVGYAASDVYALVEQEVEKNGRKIVERDAAAGTLVVAYPFSLLKNNWGGTIKVICVADAFGTTVTLLGDGRDAVPRVQAIGNEVLSDVAAALRRLPRTL